MEHENRIISEHKNRLNSEHQTRIISEHTEKQNTEIYGKNATPQNLGPHFVRACATEMHFNMSQKSLDTEIYTKNAAPQSQPRTHTHTHSARAWAVEMHVNISQEPLNAEIYTKNVAPQNLGPHFTRATLSRIYRKNAAPQSQPRMQTHTLCEPAQSKCMSTFQKSHFIRKFTGKMPAPRVSTLIKHRPLHLP